MDISIYQQIIALRLMANEIERGYRFEALIREIQPWDVRPPIVMNPKSEQLDGVYQYKGTTFIIECKAVKKKITPGSKEWEDFELKIRKRHGHGVIGIYCSLFPVSEELYQSGMELNRSGYHNFILADSIWTDLNEHKIDFKHVVEYMIPNVRARFISHLDSIEKLNKYCFDKDTISRNITNICKKNSSIFLRRHKHKYHEKLYVRRAINEQIENILNYLKPSLLENQNNKKEPPKQIIIIRDLSGSGKTTFAIDSVMHSQHFFCFGNAAKDIEIDSILEHFIESLNQNQSFLQEIRIVNKPILYFIDSLDENSHDQTEHKRKEIISTIKKLEELNHIANEHQFLTYPLAIAFTVREEYWRNWDSIFEGRRDVTVLHRRITNYTDSELEMAFSNYFSVYNYNIINILNYSSKSILSSPINLEIFSEGNEYEGDILVEDVWEGKIVSSYFKKKEDNIFFKHTITGFTPNIFNLLLSGIAFSLILSNTNNFSKAHLKKIIKLEHSHLDGYLDQILQKLISEQIIIQDTENSNILRFKYTKFIEYLVALHIIIQIEEEDNIDLLESFTQSVFDSNIVSMYSVLSLMRHIARTKDADLELRLNNYYANSNLYLSKRLPLLRLNISLGEATSNEDLKMLLENTYSKNPVITWDTFFIVAAKNNKQIKNKIIETFEVAWDTNQINSLRWKIIDKLSSHNLLLEEKVLFRILESTKPKEWEVYLGFIVNRQLRNEFNKTCSEANLNVMFDKLLLSNDPEWSQVRGLINSIVNNDKFVNGNVYSEKVEYNILKNRITSQNELLETHLSKEQVLELNRLYDNIRLIIMNNSSIYYLVSQQIKNLQEDELNYIINKINSLLRTEVPQNEPLANYIISNHEHYNNFISLLIECPELEVEINRIGTNRKTAYQEVVDSNIPNKYKYINFLYSRGFRKNNIDNKYLELRQEKISELSKEELTSFLICKAAYDLNSQLYIQKLCDAERVVLVIFTFKYNRIVGSGFNNLIQVVNNALQYYTEFGELIIESLIKYNRIVELSEKPSFIKKLDAFRKNNYKQSHEFDDILEIIFPELFTKF